MGKITITQIPNRTTLRYNYLFEKENQKASLNPVVDKKGLTPDFSDIVASGLSRRPILLIGDVGVGKSSFMNNLIKVEAENIFQNSITFIIDLGSQAVLSHDVRNTIIDEIYRQLLEDYGIDVQEDNFVRGTYNLELIRFRNGIHKSLFKTNGPKAIEKEIEFLELKIEDKIEHLKNSLIHISKGRKKQIAIFIDNCDQRDDSTQQIAFLIAHEFAEHWPTIVFVSLRPETFHRSITAGALSGYHPKAFTISPPRIDEVLEKRLNFAQKIARGDIPSTQIKADFKFSRLATLIEILNNSFKNNKHLLEFIDNISYGNIRQAIVLVNGFLGSGHVDTGKILDIDNESGQYIIPLHEFLRAVIFGDNIYYDPNSSPITNLFDVHYYDKKEHFLLPILLYTLHARLISGKNDGFLETDKAYNHLQRLGFTVDQVDIVIKNAYTRKLLETSSRGNLINPENLPSMLRITAVGVYHICNLYNLFPYIDAIIVDTPIFDRESREKIHDVSRIDERLYRAEIFKDYFRQCLE